MPLLFFLLALMLVEPEADVDLSPWYKHCAPLVCFVYTKTTVYSPRPHTCHYFMNGEPAGGQVVRRTANFTFVVPAAAATFLSVECQPVRRLAHSFK